MVDSTGEKPVVTIQLVLREYRQVTLDLRGHREQNAADNLENGINSLEDDADSKENVGAFLEWQGSYYGLEADSE